MRGYSISASDSLLSLDPDDSDSESTIPSFCLISSTVYSYDKDMRLTVFIEKLRHLFFYSLSNRDFYGSIRMILRIDHSQHLEVANVNKGSTWLEL